MRALGDFLLETVITIAIVALVAYVVFFSQGTDRGPDGLTVEERNYRKEIADKKAYDATLIEACRTSGGRPVLAVADMPGLLISGRADWLRLEVCLPEGVTTYERNLVR